MDVERYKKRKVIQYSNVGTEGIIIVSSNPFHSISFRQAVLILKFFY